MFRFAALLMLVFGLALGLWIGFNPQLHREAMQSRNHARAVLVDARLQFQNWVDDLRTPNTPSSRHPASDVPRFSWERFTANLSQIWEQVKLGFSRLTVQVHLPK